MLKKTSIVLLGCLFITNCANDKIVNPAPAASAPPVTFAKVLSIVQSRCMLCHSAATGTGGIVLETEEQIRLNISKIKERVVDKKNMPWGNLTKMTLEERNLIGQWISSGAK